MNPSTLEQARETVAPSHLEKRIVSSRNRRMYAQRVVGSTLLLGTLIAFASLSPKAAYAGLPGSIEKTNAESVVEIKYWRDIRGKVTEPSIARYSGKKSWIRHGNSQMLDDGVVRTQYVDHLGVTIIDASHPEPGVRSRTKLILDPRWKWRSPQDTEYKGVPATLHQATGSFRDSGRDNTIETKIFTEPNGGRLLYSESWRENHTYADFWEYSYPQYSDSLFAISVPPGAKKVDLRVVRSKIRSAAKRTRTGPVMVLADSDGTVVLITKAKVSPNPMHPQTILLNDKISAQGMTFAFGPNCSLPQLGKDFWFEVARTTKGEPIPEKATITFKTWRTGAKGSKTGETYSANVTVTQVPDIVGLLGPLRSKKADAKWFR